MRRVALALALVALAACGGDDDASSTTPPPSTTAPASSTPATSSPPTTTESTTPPTTAPPSTDPAPSSTPPDATSTVPPPTTPVASAGTDLVGRWAHYDVVAYEDGDLKTLIISYGFNDFTDEDGQLIDTASFCYSEQRTDQPIETSLSDAGTQAIQPPPTPIEIDDVDGVLRIRRPATPTPVGIRLDDPANESLPDDPDDPRIVDDDNDGNPGITVTIRVTDDLTGELYIARREIFAYEALVVDPDTIEGVVTDNSEQLVIGASDPIFATSGDGWVQYPDPAKNPIILRRVDADWDCERLRAERDDLFPPTPEVDW